MQKRVGNEGEKQLSTLLLKLTKFLVWVVNADQFLLYPNFMLVLHLQDCRPDSKLSPNFSLGFSDNTLDFSIMHAPYKPEYIQACSDTDQEGRSLVTAWQPHMMRAIEQNGAGHLALTQSPCTAQPPKASTLLNPCDTYPGSIPARSSGPTPKAEHCTLH